MHEEAIKKAIDLINHQIVMVHMIDGRPYQTHECKKWTILFILLLQIRLSISQGRPYQ